MFATELAELGKNVKSPPVPVEAAPVAVEFDPFKPIITRVAPKPTAKGIVPSGTQALSTGPDSAGDAEDRRSVTEMRVDRLRARQARLQSGDTPPRMTMLTRHGDLVLPAGRATAAVASAGAGAGRSSGGGSGAGAGVGAGAGAGGSGLSDTELLRRAMKRRKEELEKSKVRAVAWRCGCGVCDQALTLRATQLMTTPAMRELERLERSKVYKTALIKVQFPDSGTLACDPRSQVPCAHAARWLVVRRTQSLYRASSVPRNQCRQS